MQIKNSVLIVDDSKENIDCLRGILDEFYKVYIATSGEMALKLMKNIRPDIILLDVVMPGIDGFEVLETLKKGEENFYIPVIFITSETSSFNEAKGLKMGAVDYIAKPYNPDIVSIKVRNQIHNKMYRDGLEKLVEQRTQELLDSRKAIIMGMSLLAESRDKGTGKHITRMQKYTEILAEKIHEMYPELLTKSDVDSIVSYAPLHDIGKVGIPDAILLKNGRLTNEEFDVIKTHTTFGADILRKTENWLQEDINTLQVAMEIAEFHHEKFDGTGYPKGLKGEEIPLSARIVTLADIYDALTSVREYKEAYLHDRALDIILVGDGRTKPEHFDPIVLETFKLVQEAFKELNDIE